MPWVVQEILNVADFKTKKLAEAWASKNLPMEDGDMQWRVVKI